MPLLNKKRLSLTPPMGWERKKRRKEVYYLKCTNEVFSSYESYIKRWMLCQRPIWECEVTGKQDLTYQQAKESEKAQEKRIEIKFCLVLRKRLLSFIQFQTIGLDELVNSLHNTFRYSFTIGEIIHCYLGGHTYIGKIMDIVPNPNYVAPIAIKEEEDKTNDNNVPRQANGRLRFPDAFLHPEVETITTATSATTITATSEKRQLLPSEKYKNRYSIQLIDSQGEKLENIERIIDHHEINRDPTIFKMSNLQQLVRECATRDTYQGAPWILKENVAMHYDISTELPPHLQKLQETTYQTIIKKRQYNRKLYGNNQASQGNGITSTWSIHSPSSYNKEEREAERQARREEHLRLKLQRKLEKERLREEKRKQAAVKYPIEDLDLPIYRKDPNQNWALIDMTPANSSSLLISSSPSPSIHPNQQQHEQQHEIKEIKIENNNNNININDINNNNNTNTNTTTNNNNNHINNENESTNNINNNKNDNNNNNNNLDIKDKDTIKPIHIPYPSGGRDPRPKACPKILNDLTEENFDDLISIWSFLTIFSVPLKLNTMSLDTFENSVLTTTTSVSTNTTLSSMIQAFISLINVIINERQETTTSDLLSGEIMEIYLEDHPSEDEEASDEDNENEDNEEDNDDDEEEEDKDDGKRGRKKKKKNNKKNNKVDEDEDDESDHSDTETTKKRRGRRKKEEHKSTNNIKNNNSNNKNHTENDKDSNDDVNIIGWRLKEPLRLCKDWDQKEIRLDRSPSAIKNWIIPLIGCLNDIATPDLIPNVNDILKHILPRPHSTIAERDRQFLSLSLSCKIQLLNFLVMVVNESLTIKNYMDECQEQMTELRRQKVELNKEYRSLMMRKTSLEKQERKKKKKAIKEKNTEADNNDVNDSAIDDDDDESNNESNNDSNSDEDDDDNEDNNSDDEMEDTLDESEDQSYDSHIDDEDSEIAEQSDSSKQATKGRKKSRITKYVQLHQSRQAKLKQKKIKQIAMEELKRRQNEKKREEAKLKLQASKQKAEDKRILEEEEQNLKQKEEQLEREMRQYMTLRIRPLGKDRFYNRYFYLDNVGIKDHHGTGRLYIQNPTYIDILYMMGRDNMDTNEYKQDKELICGRGGGRDFILALMKEHGFEEETTWLEKRMDELQKDIEQLDAIKKEHGSKMNHSLCSEHPIQYQHMHHQKEKSWWQYYSGPEEIQQLLAWLNPKGIREYKLRNEIAKHLSLITESMEKRDKMEKQGNARVTRGKKA